MRLFYNGTVSRIQRHRGRMPEQVRHRPSHPEWEGHTDDAGALIQATLDDVKAFLAQESPPRLSEADTKAHFVEPIIKALGWAGIGAVTREYYVRTSQEFIDDALKGPDGRPLVAIETKALQAALTDKHAAQLVQYCAVAGIEWAALTNGRALQFFNAFLTGDLAAKRLLRLDLLAFNSDGEFAAVRTQLAQLSLASMTTATGVRTWMHQRRMEALIRRQLTTPDAAPIRALADALAAEEIPATAHDLVRWFQRHLGPGTASPVVSDPAPGPTPPAKESPVTSKGIGPSSKHLPATPAKHGEQGEGVGRLFPLVEAGLLPRGTALQLAKGGQVVLHATVDARGRIVADGTPHRSPSDRAFARLLHRQSLNGWTAWRAALPEGLTTLADLRQRLGEAAEFESA